MLRSGLLPSWPPSPLHPRLQEGLQACGDRLQLPDEAHDIFGRGVLGQERFKAALMVRDDWTAFGFVGDHRYRSLLS
jgi:hypothetical protein